MPRPARFDERVIIEAALRVISAHGLTGLTTDAVATEMGGHVGSIYYRFSTKEHLLAAIWLHASRDGQQGLLEALEHPDLEQAMTATVLHYPRWSRQATPAAQLLAAYGREQVIPHWPEDLSSELGRNDDTLLNALNGFTVRWFGEATPQHRRITTFALLDLPAGAIRRYLVAGRPPPEGLDAAILAAARAALRSTL